MAHYAAPMSGSQEHKIVPGPVRGGACPPPTEIVVVEVRKVFDFCFQEDSLDRCFVVPNLGPDATVTRCEITNATCQEILEREPIPNQDGLALVSIQITLEIHIAVVPNPGAPPTTVIRTITFPKRVVLCAPAGTQVTCDVRGTCICTIQPRTPGQEQIVGEPNLCCTIQLCVVSSADPTHNPHKNTRPAG